MLIGIDKSMTPTLLHCLARMGHGDEIIIADANFPSESIAHHCVVSEAIALSGLDCPKAADLITGLMPLDGFTDYSALRMEIDGQPDLVGEVHQQVWDILTPRLPENGALGSIERQAFYAHAKTAFAVVRTAETRPYGCFILRKGVV